MSAYGGKADIDPTTAVLAIDQLHRLLRNVGRRHLHDEQIMDAAGRLRVIFPTPNWEDFVQLAFRDLRLYWAENFQIARRLRAMSDNLLATLPDSRRPALREELELLDRSIETLYVKARGSLAVSPTGSVSSNWLEIPGIGNRRCKDANRN